jgi:transposase
MNLSELAQYIEDEAKAEQALIEKGILKRYEICPFCGEDRIDRVRRTKYKCYRCNKEWGVRRGSALERLKVPFTKFLMAIKLFELDTSVRESAKQLDLAYNIVYRLYQILHHAIVITDTNYQSFPVRSRWMNPISVDEEKVTGAAELPGRSRYSGSWSAKGR